MPSLRRVMVTGASGKLGGPLCEALLAAGYDVLAARHHNPVNVPGVREVAVDLGDAKAVEDLVAQSEAVIHLATCKEDRQGVIDTSARGTFHLLDAAMRTKSLKRFLLASGNAVNGIYFRPQPAPITEETPLVAYPGYYPLSKVLEEAMTQQFHHQAGVPTVILRMSWIHAEDDILSHLTVAGEPFGVPVWRELMNDQQRAEFAGGADAAVALRDPTGGPCGGTSSPSRITAQAHLLALERPNVEGQTFLIAMNEPLDYVEAAGYAADKLGIGTLDLVDPVGQDFYIDVSKARYVLGYRPRYDIFALIDQAVAFRRSGQPRRARAGYRG